MNCIYIYSQVSCASSVNIIVSATDTTCISSRWGIKRHVHSIWRPNSALPFSQPNHTDNFQGPIYNNVQPRTTQPPQNAYPSAPQTTSTAYPTNQYPDSYSHQEQQQQQQQQQPVQYTQAQFGRQRSREPVQVSAPSPAPATDPSGYPYQANYQSNYPQEPLQAVNNVGGGWKHIGAPQPKSRSEFTAGNGAYPPFQGSYQQQQQQPQVPSWSDWIPIFG